MYTVNISELTIEEVLTRTDEYDKIILKIETNPDNIRRLKHKIK